MIRILIIDDEIEACEGLEFLLESEAQFEVIGVCRDGKQAIQMIDSLKPDLIFLDIQMPEKNGFEVLESIETTSLPMVVFTTAYDEYALDAFKVHALDYLQKPFTDSRFEECLRHIKTQFDLKQDNERLRSFVEQTRAQTSNQTVTDQLIIRSSGKIYFLEHQDIKWIEGFDYYIKVHAHDRFYLVRNSLSKISQELPAQFIRIHNSTIINRHHLRELEPLSRGSYQVYLKDGKELVMSKKYKDLHANLFP